VRPPTLRRRGARALLFRGPSTKGGRMIMFRARTDSPTEGVIEWNGSVRGEALEGTYVWTKKGQKPITYWDEGNAREVKEGKP